MFSRSSRIKLKITLLTILVIANIVLVTASEKKPNIFLVLIEDVGMQLGYNTKGLKTPTLDDIISKGILFDNAYCAYPTCSPSKTSIFTGRYAHAHHTVRNTTNFMEANPTLNDKQEEFEAPLRVPDDVPTLVEILKENNYYTGLTRKFHMCPTTKFPFNEWIKSGSEDEILPFISRSGNKPFFLMFNIPDCHRPYINHINSYKWDLIPNNKIEVPPYLPNTSLMKTDWAEYLTTIEIVDDKLRKALNKLKQSDEYENTIIIVTSDHGPAIHRGKFSAYHFGSHIPLIIGGPAIDSNKKVNDLVGHIDIMPTILDFANIKSEAFFDGKSLRPFLVGDTNANGHDYLLTEVQYAWDTVYGISPYVAHDFALFDGTYRYILRKNVEIERWQPADNYMLNPWKNYAYKATIEAKNEYPLAYELLNHVFVSAPEVEMFDISTDYWCINNIIDSVAYAGEISRLSLKLDDIINEAGIYNSPAELSEIAYQDNKIEIYPNPFENSISLKSNGLQEINSISIYSVSGGIIKRAIVADNSSNTVHINLSGLNAGVYILTIQYNDGRIKAERIIKK